MKKVHNQALFLLFSFLLTTFDARPNAQISNYPDDLLGTWEITHSSVCILPVDHDSQTAIVIKKRGLVEYEEWLEPIRITQVSKKPRAWKVDSIQHIYERKSQKTQILVLDKHGRLTVTDEHRTVTYSRCT